MKTDELTREDLEMLNFCLRINVSRKMGKFVFFQLNGKTHARRAPGKYEPGSGSEKQKANRNRFLALTNYAHGLKETIIDPIWNQAARHKNMSGYNLFVKTNYPAFDTTGQVTDPLLLHFSAGTLNLPRKLTAALDPENPGMVLVNWINEQWGKLPSWDDCLMCITYPRETIEMVNTGFTRLDTKARLDWHPSEDKDAFLFLFFWNKNRNSYSPDQAFRIQ